MNGQPIGILMPVYNDARHLPLSIPAILKQEKSIGHFLIVDDGSTDNSLQKIRELTDGHPCVEIIARQKNTGIFESHQLALEKIQTKYIYYAGADDRVLDGFFQKSLELLEKHNEAALCCSDCLLLCEENGRFREQKAGLSEKSCFIPPAEFRKILAGRENFNFSCSSVIVRREALLAAGGFRPETKWHCDWFTYTTLALRHGFCHVPETLTVFRLASSGMSHSGPARKKDRRAVYRNFLRILREPQFADVRQAWRIPSLLSPGRNGRRTILMEAVKNPRNWRFVSVKLLRACLRDRFRKPLWELLWFLLTPLRSPMAEAAKRGALRLFGAKINGTPKIHPCVKISDPWNLVLHHNACLSYGTQIFCPAPVEIGENALLDRETLVQSAAWNDRVAPLTWNVGRVVIGKNACVGVRTVIMPGVRIEDSARIPALQTVCRENRP